ncbi:tail protein X [Psychrobacter celer]|uniref:tail protein X n=1 Tax=Psychrobacter celer TaxID=306572 RepID=UPI003FD371D6
MRTVQTMQGDTVDLICLRYFGFTGGVTEQVMSLNPQLTNHYLVLPALINIALPDAPKRQQKEIIQLWT